MKLFQHITDKEDCLESYRILGLTVMEKATVFYRQRAWTNKPLKKEYKRFFGKIIYKEKFYNFNGIFKKEINILGIPVVSKLRLNGYISLFILGIKFYSRPLRFLLDFKTECLYKLDRNHDDIYVLLHHLGDAFRMLTIIKTIINNNHSKNPLIMVFSESFVDLIKMMNLEIPYIYIETTKPFKTRMETMFSKDEFEFCGFRFFLLWNQWAMSTKFFYLIKTQPPTTHRIDIQASAYNVHYDNHKMGKIIILPEAEANMIKICKNEGLNLDRFIFVAPEAFYCNMCSIEFWERLIKILKSSGYDIFINTVSIKHKESKHSYTNDKAKLLDLDKLYNAKSFYLTVAEAYALAAMAKKIISQRSGFSELLVQTNVPICVLYTGDNKDQINHYMEVESIKRSPYANPEKIFEINISGMSVDESIQSVIKSLEISSMVA